MASTVEAPNDFRILDFEIESGDVVFVRLARGPAEIEAMFYAHLIGRVAALSRLDIQGAGPNTIGWARL